MLVVIEAFLTTSKSEVRVVDKCIWLPMLVSKQKIYEVLHLDPNYTRVLKNGSQVVQFI